MMQYIGVSDCDMEKGQLRCDANVSVRARGARQFGTKAEVKNLNSFRFLKLALEYEIERQVEVLESGGKVEQETRLYNPDTGQTVGMRSKEHAHDYRYFPEPDLAPLRISEHWLKEIKAKVPELARERRARFLSEYGLREYDAQVLTASRDIADYFEAAAQASGDAKAAAKWLSGDLMGLLNAAGKPISESPVHAAQLGDLIALINSGQLSGKLAKEILPKMFETGESATTIMEREGLKPISDTATLDNIVDEVLATNVKQVEQYKAGKTTVIGFLVGQVMKATRGQANPAAAAAALKRKLG
jgi:aspartyl-tRNA(Asn)/glutamyl-tRNA(Gln) amidotransferase subunit B